MRIALDSAAVRLEFDDREELRAFFSAAVAENGFLVTLTQELRQFETRAFVATVTSDDVEVPFEARVLQIFPNGSGGFRIAFELAGWGAQKEAELARALASRGDDDSVDTAPTTGTSPIFQIREMTPPQRMRLALKAKRTERHILLRDTSPQVLMSLLGNPRIDDEDIIQIAKSTYVTSAILKRIAENRRWSGNPEILSAVVRNPKTPPPLALHLLESLRTSDLQVMAKSSFVRESLRKAALRIYLKRTGR